MSYYDSTNITDLWLMDSTSSDGGGEFVANEIGGGSNLYIEGTFGVETGFDGNAIHAYYEIPVHGGLIKF